MLKGHVFSKQIFGNPMFALFINTFLNGRNGVSNNYKNGMQVTYSGSNLTIDSGAVCIQGRFLEEDTGSTVAAGTDTAYCKLVIEINLDLQNTESQFNQGVYKVVKSASSYPNLTQTNIVKNNAGIYQYELARFRTNASGITDFKDMRTFLDFNSIYEKITEEYRTVLQELENELANVLDGSDYLLKSTGGTVKGLITAEGGIKGNVTGNADTSNKLSTKRTIAVSGAVSGSTEFDGSGNVTIITKQANIAVITGRTGENAGIINLPEGFNANNSVIIGLLLNSHNKPENWGYGSTMDSSNSLTGCFPVKVYLKNTNAIITVKDIEIIDGQNPTIISPPDLNFKLVLMKIA